MNGLLDDLTLDSENVSLDAMVNNISNGVASNTESQTEVAETNEVVSSAESNDEYTLKFDRPTFSKLLGTLKIIENICNDVEIREGIIRAKTNNNKGVLDINLQSIFQDKNLLISMLKMRLGLLKTFELDMNTQVDGDASIILQSNLQNYEFMDSLSKMTFRRPAPKFLDNPFIEDSEFNNIVSGCKDDSLIFTYTISAYLKQRLSTVCEGFRVDSIKFEFHGNYAKLGIETKSKEETSKNAAEIPLLQNIDNKMFTMINMPLTLQIASDVKISCYKLGGELAMCKCELNHFGIPFILYSKMKFANMV